VTGEVKDAAGKEVGTVRIKTLASGLKLNLRGLPPGEHAAGCTLGGTCYDYGLVFPSHSSMLRDLSLGP
jgi:hypothetical protein